MPLCNYKKKSLENLVMSQNSRCYIVVAMISTLRSGTFNYYQPRGEQLPPEMKGNKKFKSGVYKSFLTTVDPKA